jgi:hypothetical protein
LCKVLNLSSREAQRLAALAIIENAKPEKREVLRNVFFGWWSLLVATLPAVGGLLLAATTNDAKAASERVQIVAQTAVDSARIVRSKETSERPYRSIHCGKVATFLRAMLACFGLGTRFASV